MAHTESSLQTSQPAPGSSASGAEPLDGSGFENEVPEPEPEANDEDDADA